jgi:hypothetical protein
VNESDFTSTLCHLLFPLLLLPLFLLGDDEARNDDSIASIPAPSRGGAGGRTLNMMMSRSTPVCTWGLG